MGIHFVKQVTIIIRIFYVHGYKTYKQAINQLKNGCSNKIPRQMMFTLIYMSR